MREPFLDRNPEPGSWDHAMTWIGYALPVGNEVYLYYGGYARGHKVEMQTERQIGLARMKRDRYVAIAPKSREGRLVTRAFRWPVERLTVNADATLGEVSVRVLDAEGKPLNAMDDGAAQAIRGDVLAGEVRWPQGVESLTGKAVRLEFQVKDAALFAIDFGAQPS
jgi:hypothetical protein